MRQMYYLFTDDVNDRFNAISETSGAHRDTIFFTLVNGSSVAGRALILVTRQAHLRVLNLLSRGRRSGPAAKSRDLSLLSPRGLERG